MPPPLFAARRPSHAAVVAAASPASFAAAPPLSAIASWLPDKLDVCQEVIFNSVTTGAIEEIQFEEGQVVDRQWILHHFEYDSFRVFGFLDDFALPTARPGNSANQREGFHENIQRAFYSGYFRKHGLNSLTAIRVLAGTKNSRPVGFYSRNSTKSTVNPNTTIPQI